MRLSANQASWERRYGREIFPGRVGVRQAARRVSGV